MKREVRVESNFYEWIGASSLFVADWRTENEWSLFQCPQKKDGTMNGIIDKTVSDVPPDRND